MFYKNYEKTKKSNIIKKNGKQMGSREQAKPRQTLGLSPRLQAPTKKTAMEMFSDKKTIKNL